MRITYMNGDNSVGNETSYQSTFAIPIASGLRQELRFYEMHTVTSFTIKVQRNNSTVLNKTVPVSTTMIIDLSVFSSLLPSLPSMLGGTRGNPTESLKDTVEFIIVDGGINRSYLFYLVAVNSPRLNVRGWARQNERNLCSSAGRSEVKTSLVTVSNGATKEEYTHITRGLTTRVKSSTNFPIPTQVCKMIGGGGHIPEGDITQGIFIENMGNDVYVKFEKKMPSKTLVETVEVKGGFSGNVSATFPYERFSNFEMSFTVWAKSYSSVDVVLGCYMINHGCKLGHWVRTFEGEDDNGACVGSMTDYGSGRANRIKFDPTGMTAVSSYGYSDALRVYFPTKSVAETKRLYVDGVFNSVVLSGYRINDRVFKRVLRWDNNENGNVYGWIEYEDKIPRHVSVDNTVLIRWLNSRGFEDSMYFEKFTIKPVLVTNNSGGGGIEYYEVTVQTNLTDDNTPCFEWMQRSSVIKAQIPVDIHQIGKAEFLSYNILQVTGSTGIKAIQLKFKIYMQEP